MAYSANTSSSAQVADVHRLSWTPFLQWKITLAFWILTPLLFASGYLLGRRQNRRWRRDRFAALERKLQLIAARNEMKGYRHKRKRPMLARWQKFLLGWLHNFNPTLTFYTNFRAETLVGWHRRFVKRW